MPPSKTASAPDSEAAKKSAKKAGKKAPHHHKKHHESKDLRRAYEHLGRLRALEPSLSSKITAQIKLLTQLAESALLADEAKDAADLLRAGEHLAFGSLAAKTKSKPLSEALAMAIHAEYEHLVDKAQHHWHKHEGDRPATIEGLNTTLTAMAEQAFGAAAYPRALEFARAAEALSKVSRGGESLLEDGEFALGEAKQKRGEAKQKKLKA